MTLALVAGSLAGMRWRRRGEVEEPAPTKEAIETRTRAWREALASQLAPAGGLGYWDESIDAPFSAGVPDWNGYGALVLWAAYSEQPGFARPREVPLEWHKDAALAESRAPGFQTAFPMLVHAVELWLPGTFASIVETTDPFGEEVVVGPLARLEPELERLNLRTWRADDEAVHAWRERFDPNAASLEEAARLGYAVFRELAGEAVERGLPLRLDY